MRAFCKALCKSPFLETLPILGKTLDAATFRDRMMASWTTIGVVGALFLTMLDYSKVAECQGDFLLSIMPSKEFCDTIHPFLCSMGLAFNVIAVILTTILIMQVGFVPDEKLGEWVAAMPITVEMPLVSFIVGALMWAGDLVWLGVVAHGPYGMRFVLAASVIAIALLGENIARERKIIVGIIIVITLVLIFAVVFGVKRYITHRNSSPVQSEVVGSPEHVPLCVIRPEEREDNGGTVQDNGADEQEESPVRQAMNNRPNNGLIPLDVLEAAEHESFTGDLRQDQPKIDLIPSDCKVSEMSQLHNHENQILLHHVQKKLDHLEKQSKRNWRSVGQIFNVSEEDLDLIETDYKAGRSPTESLVGILSTFSTVPSMRGFVEALVACNRYDVANNICNWPWDLRTVQ